MLFAAAIFIFGVTAWGDLKQELLPDIDFPVVTVVAPYPGSGTSDVAEQVAKPIERAIAGIPRLERLQSTSANSVALVVAQFEFGTDVKETLATIEANLASAGLPATVETTVQALNINQAPVITASIAATSADGLDRAGEIARTEIVPEIQALDGVARADLTGGTEDQLVITLDPAKLAGAGVSTQQVVGVLQANNLTFPSGQLPSGSTRIPVSTIGRIGSAEQVSAMVVGAIPPTAQGGQPTPVTIGDLGTVEAVQASTTGFARTNGNPSLSLSVTKTSAGNTVIVADEVTAKLNEIAARHPGEITVTVVSDLSTFIEESRDGLLKEGGLGALFAVITILLFLTSIRSTLVAAISIPLSVLAALVLMQLFGVTMNVMTLGGLAVAVGRVVDDAIVVLENIYRHRALGEDRMTAITRGPREVAAAITSSTLTTVLVFLPIGFVGGLVSQIFLPFALTVTFALLASLICALTVVPVLAYFLVDRVKPAVDETGEPRNSFWVRVYTPTIRAVLRSKATRLAVVGIAAVLFIAATSLAPLLPTQFINAGSEKILQVTIAPPGGTFSEAVLDRAAQAEQILLADPNVELVQTSVAGESDISFQTIIAAQSGRPANSATIVVRLDPSVDLAAQSQKLAADLAPVEGDGYSVEVSQAASFTSNAISVVVSAEDPALVESTTAAVLASMSQNPDLTNVKTDLVKATPEVQVTVDSNKAIAVGSTAAQVAGEVRSALTGQTITTVVLADGQPADLVVQLDPEQVQSVDDLRALPVGTVAKVPLGTIATVEEVNVQGSITRIDQAPSATISGQVAGDDTGRVSREVQQAIDALEANGTIPPGVDVRLAGVTEQQSEAFGGLFASMGVAILLVYVMLVLTFNSLVTPFIILFSLPLALIGAFSALLITDRPIGVSALIGFLMLIGIVVTNAIVLLDLVERLRREGHSTHDALIEGGRTRVRPILMTALATILALIPLAAGFNQGSIIAAELGTVVIGGLFSSTFLTLIVVPVVYSLVDDFRSWVSGRLTRRRPEPVAVAASPAGG